MFNDARLGHEHESAILTICESHCSRYLLLLAGDVERNPGPISRGNSRHVYTSYIENFILLAHVYRCKATTVRSAMYVIH